MPERWSTCTACTGSHDGVLSSGKIPIETIARKMSHAVADCFSDSGAWLYQRRSMDLWWWIRIIPGPWRAVIYLPNAAGVRLKELHFVHQVNAHLCKITLPKREWSIWMKAVKASDFYLIVVEMNLRLILALIFISTLTYPVLKEGRNSSGYFESEETVPLLVDLQIAQSAVSVFNTAILSGTNNNELSIHILKKETLILKIPEEFALLQIRTVRSLWGEITNTSSTNSAGCRGWMAGNDLMEFYWFLGIILQDWIKSRGKFFD